MEKIPRKTKTPFGSCFISIAIGLLVIGILIWVSVLLLFSYKNRLVAVQTITLPGIDKNTLSTPALGVDDRAQATKLPVMEKRSLNALHRDGQTFLTWVERTDQARELYRIYRSNQLINQDNYHQAKLLVEVGENSATFYANRVVDTSGKWYLRLTERFIIENNGAPLPPGLGLFVWTLSREDFGGERLLRDHRDAIRGRRDLQPTVDQRTR
jgi:hypothetical protein